MSFKTKSIWKLRLEQCGILVVFMVLFAFFIKAFYSVIISQSTDFPAHIKHALYYAYFFDMDFQKFYQTSPLGLSVMYPLWHLIFLFLYKSTFFIKTENVESLTVFVENQFFPADPIRLVIAASILQSIVIILTIGILFFIFKKIFKEKNVFSNFFFAFLIVFCGPLYFPFINEKYYLGQLFSGLWHNPTIQPVKPLLLLLFFLYCYLIKSNERLDKENYFFLRFSIKKSNFYFIIFSILLFISIWFKTSLAMILIPAIFIYCCIEFFVEKNYNFIFYMKTCFSLLPATVSFFLQFFFLTGSSVGRDIEIGYMLFSKIYSDFPWLSIIISLPFPILVLFLCRKEIYRSKLLLLSVISYLIAMVLFLFFNIEPHAYGDFAWSVHLFTLLLFATTFIEFRKYLDENRSKGMQMYMIKLLGYGFLLSQFFFGFVYFLNLVRGIGYSGGWHF